MPKVMEANIIKLCSLPDEPPGFLDIDKLRALALSGEDIGVVWLWFDVVNIAFGLIAQKECLSASL